MLGIFTLRNHLLQVRHWIEICQTALPMNRIKLRQYFGITGTGLANKVDEIEAIKRLAPTTLRTGFNYGASARLCAQDNGGSDG